MRKNGSKMRPASRGSSKASEDAAKQSPSAVSSSTTSAAPAASARGLSPASPAIATTENQNLEANNAQQKETREQSEQQQQQEKEKEEMEKLRLRRRQLKLREKMLKAQIFSVLKAELAAASSSSSTENSAAGVDNDDNINDNSQSQKSHTLLLNTNTARKKRGEGLENKIKEIELELRRKAQTLKSIRDEAKQKAVDRIRKAREEQLGKQIDIEKQTDIQINEIVVKSQQEEEQGKEEEEEQMNPIDEPTIIEEDFSSPSPSTTPTTAGLRPYPPQLFAVLCSVASTLTSRTLHAYNHKQDEHHEQPQQQQDKERYKAFAVKKPLEAIPYIPIKYLEDVFGEEAEGKSTTTTTLLNKNKAVNAGKQKKQQQNEYFAFGKQSSASSSLSSSHEQQERKTIASSSPSASVVAAVVPFATVTTTAAHMSKATDIAANASVRQLAQMILSGGKKGGCMLSDGESTTTNNTQKEKSVASASLSSYSSLASPLNRTPPPPTAPAPTPICLQELAGDVNELVSKMITATSAKGKGTHCDDDDDDGDDVNSSHSIHPLNRSTFPSSAFSPVATKDSNVEKRIEDEFKKISLAEHLSSPLSSLSSHPSPNDAKDTNQHDKDSVSRKLMTIIAEECLSTAITTIEDDGCGGANGKRGNNNNNSHISNDDNKSKSKNHPHHAHTVSSSSSHPNPNPLRLATPFAFELYNNTSPSHAEVTSYGIITALEEVCLGITRSKQITNMTSNTVTAETAAAAQQKKKGEEKGEEEKGNPFLLLRALLQQPSSTSSSHNEKETEEKEMTNPNNNNNNDDNSSYGFTRQQFVAFMASLFLSIAEEEGGTSTTTAASATAATPADGNHSYFIRTINRVIYGDADEENVDSDENMETDTVNTNEKEELQVIVDAEMIKNIIQKIATQSDDDNKENDNAVMDSKKIKESLATASSAYDLSNVGPQAEDKLKDIVSQNVEFFSSVNRNEDDEALKNVDLQDDDDDEDDDFFFEDDKFQSDVEDLTYKSRRMLQYYLEQSEEKAASQFKQAMAQLEEKKKDEEIKLERQWDAKTKRLAMRIQQFVQADAVTFDNEILPKLQKKCQDRVERKQDEVNRQRRQREKEKAAKTETLSKRKKARSGKKGGDGEATESGDTIISIMSLSQWLNTVVASLNHNGNANDDNSSPLTAAGSTTSSSLANLILLLFARFVVRIVATSLDGLPFGGSGNGLVSSSNTFINALLGRNGGLYELRPHQQQQQQPQQDDDDEHQQSNKNQQQFTLEQNIQSAILSELMPSSTTPTPTTHSVDAATATQNMLMLMPATERLSAATSLLKTVVLFVNSMLRTPSSENQKSDGDDDDENEICDDDEGRLDDEYASSYKHYYVPSDYSNLSLAQSHFKTKGFGHTPTLLTTNTTTSSSSVLTSSSSSSSTPSFSSSSAALMLPHPVISESRDDETPQRGSLFYDPSTTSTTSASSSLLSSSPATTSNTSTSSPFSAAVTVQRMLRVRLGSPVWSVKELLLPTITTRRMSVKKKVSRGKQEKKGQHNSGSGSNKRSSSPSHSFPSLIDTLVAFEEAVFYAVQSRYYSHAQTYANKVTVAPSSSSSVASLSSYSRFGYGATRSTLTSPVSTASSDNNFAGETDEKMRMNRHFLMLYTPFGSNGTMKPMLMDRLQKTETANKLLLSLINKNDNDTPHPSTTPSSSSSASACANLSRLIAYDSLPLPAFQDLLAIQQCILFGGPMLREEALVKNTPHLWGEGVIRDRILLLTDRARRGRCDENNNDDDDDNIGGKSSSSPSSAACSPPQQCDSIRLIPIPTRWVIDELLPWLLYSPINDSNKRRGRDYDFDDEKQKMVGTERSSSSSTTSQFMDFVEELVEVREEKDVPITHPHSPPPPQYPSPIPTWELIVEALKMDQNRRRRSGNKNENGASEGLTSSVVQLAVRVSGKLLETSTTTEKIDPTTQSNGASLSSSPRFFTTYKLHPELEKHLLLSTPTSSSSSSSSSSMSVITSSKVMCTGSEWLAKVIADNCFSSNNAEDGGDNGLFITKEAFVKAAINRIRRNKDSSSSSSSHSYPPFMFVRVGLFQHLWSRFGGGDGLAMYVNSSSQLDCTEGFLEVISNSAASSSSLLSSSPSVALTAANPPTQSPPLSTTDVSAPSSPSPPLLLRGLVPVSVSLWVRATLKTTTTTTDLHTTEEVINFVVPQQADISFSSTATAVVSTPPSPSLLLPESIFSLPSHTTVRDALVSGVVPITEMIGKHVRHESNKGYDKNVSSTEMEEEEGVKKDDDNASSSNTTQQLKSLHVLRSLVDGGTLQDLLLTAAGGAGGAGWGIASTASSTIVDDKFILQYRVTYVSHYHHDHSKSQVNHEGRRLLRRTDWAPIDSSASTFIGELLHADVVGARSDDDEEVVAVSSSSSPPAVIEFRIVLRIDNLFLPSPGEMTMNTSAATRAQATAPIPFSSIVGVGNGDGSTQSSPLSAATMTTKRRTLHMFGLDNCGNTCFLNSTVQCLSNLVIFRRGVMSVGGLSNTNYVPIHRNLRRAYGKEKLGGGSEATTAVKTASSTSTSSSSCFYRHACQLLDDDDTNNTSTASSVSDAVSFESKTDAMIKKAFNKELNITRRFQELLRMLWSGRGGGGAGGGGGYSYDTYSSSSSSSAVSSAINPRTFVDAFKEKVIAFRGTDQHDAADFFMAFINAMRDECDNGHSRMTITGGVGGGGGSAAAIYAQMNVNLKSYRQRNLTSDAHAIVQNTLRTLLLSKEEKKDGSGNHHRLIETLKTSIKAELTKGGKVSSSFSSEELQKLVENKLIFALHQSLRSHLQLGERGGVERGKGKGGKVLLTTNPYVDDVKAFWFDSLVNASSASLFTRLLDGQRSTTNHCLRCGQIATTHETFLVWNVPLAIGVEKSEKGGGDGSSSSFSSYSSRYSSSYASTPNYSYDTETPNPFPASSLINFAADSSTSIVHPQQPSSCCQFYVGYEFSPPPPPPSRLQQQQMMVYNYNYKDGVATNLISGSGEGGGNGGDEKEETEVATSDAEIVSALFAAVKKTSALLHEFAVSSSLSITNRRRDHHDDDDDNTITTAAALINREKTEERKAALALEIENLFAQGEREEVETGDNTEQEDCDSESSSSSSEISSDFENVDQFFKVDDDDDEYGHENDNPIANQNEDHLDDVGDVATSDSTSSSPLSSVSVNKVIGTFSRKVHPRAKLQLLSNLASLMPTVYVDVMLLTSPSPSFMLIGGGGVKRRSNNSNKTLIRVSIPLSASDHHRVIIASIQRYFYTHEHKHKHNEQHTLPRNSAPPSAATADVVGGDDINSGDDGVNDAQWIDAMIDNHINSLVVRKSPRRRFGCVLALFNTVKSSTTTRRDTVTDGFIAPFPSPYYSDTNAALLSMNNDDPNQHQQQQQYDYVDPFSAMPCRLTQNHSLVMVPVCEPSDFIDKNVLTGRNKNNNNEKRYTWVLVKKSKRRANDVTEKDKHRVLGSSDDFSMIAIPTPPPPSANDQQHPCCVETVIRKELAEQLRRSRREEEGDDVCSLSAFKIQNIVLKSTPSISLPSPASSSPLNHQQCCDPSASPFVFPLTEMAETALHTLPTNIVVSEEEARPTFVMKGSSSLPLSRLDWWNIYRQQSLFESNCYYECEVHVGEDGDDEKEDGEEGILLTIDESVRINSCPYYECSDDDDNEYDDDAQEDGGGVARVTTKTIIRFPFGHLNWTPPQQQNQQQRQSDNKKMRSDVASYSAILSVLRGVYHRDDVQSDGNISSGVSAAVSTTMQWALIERLVIVRREKQTQQRRRGGASNNKKEKSTQKKRRQQQDKSKAMNVSAFYYIAPLLPSASASASTTNGVSSKLKSITTRQLASLDPMLLFATPTSQKEMERTMMMKSDSSSSPSATASSSPSQSPPQDKSLKKMMNALQQEEKGERRRVGGRGQKQHQQQRSFGEILQKFYTETAMAKIIVPNKSAAATTSSSSFGIPRLAPPPPPKKLFSSSGFGAKKVVENSVPSQTAAAAVAAPEEATTTKTAKDVKSDNSENDVDAFKTLPFKDIISLCCSPKTSSSSPLSLTSSASPSSPSSSSAALDALRLILQHSADADEKAWKRQFMKKRVILQVIIAENEKNKTGGGVDAEAAPSTASSPPPPPPPPRPSSLVSGSRLLLSQKPATTTTTLTPSPPTPSAVAATPPSSPLAPPLPPIISTKTTPLSLEGLIRDSAASSLQQHTDGQAACQHCGNSKGDAMRVSDVTVLPPCLAFGIKRFSQQGGATVKNSRELQFPLKMDLSQLVAVGKSRSISISSSLSSSPSVPSSSSPLYRFMSRWADQCLHAASPSLLTTLAQSAPPTRQCPTAHRWSDGMPALRQQQRRRDACFGRDCPSPMPRLWPQAEGAADDRRRERLLLKQQLCSGIAPDVGRFFGNAIVEEGEGHCYDGDENEDEDDDQNPHARQHQKDSSSSSSFLYALKGIVIHSGSLNGGHYWAYCKNMSSDSGNGGTWLCHDDSSVYSVEDGKMRGGYGAAADCSENRSNSNNSSSAEVLREMRRQLRELTTAASKQMEEEEREEEEEDNVNDNSTTTTKASPPQPSRLERLRALRDCLTNATTNNNGNNKKMGANSITTVTSDFSPSDHCAAGGGPYMLFYERVPSREAYDAIVTRRDIELLEAQIKREEEEEEEEVSKAVVTSDNNRNDENGEENYHTVPREDITPNATTTARHSSSSFTFQSQPGHLSPLAVPLPSLELAIADRCVHWYQRFVAPLPKLKDMIGLMFGASAEYQRQQSQQNISQRTTDNKEVGSVGQNNAVNKTESSKIHEDNNEEKDRSEERKRERAESLGVSDAAAEKLIRIEGGGGGEVKKASDVNLTDFANLVPSSKKKSSSDEI